MIGVMTVITISSIISGLNNNVEAWVDSLGSNVLWIYHMPVIGVRPTAAMLARRKMTTEDAIAMRTLPHVVATNAGARHVNVIFQVGVIGVKYGTKKAQGTMLEGDTTSLPEVTDFNLKEGRMFTQGEDDRAANVVILGHDTAQKLFGRESAVGKEVEIEGDLFTVIGVADKLKQVFGGGTNPDDNKATFPLRTFVKLHPEDKDRWLSVKYDDPKNRALVEDEIRELLRRRRKVPTWKPDDFEIFAPDSIARLWKQLTGGLAIFMVAVSSVGLMVGGVGVMNIMLVSVTERTREIGVRKALGARQRDVLLQFLIESATMAVSGGAIGVLCGILVGKLITIFVGFPTSVPVWAIFLGLFLAGSVGIFFGVYPASKAAKLDPVVALRAEL